ncbi:MAG: hypothetical protein J6X43_01835, partial [Bacteroidales bacterium]|nr:hypothetical protein [Bacteroidales bacterium]
MKHLRFLLALGAMVGLFAMSATAGNDYLKQEKHYLAYAAGQDKVHFKIPVYAYASYNHWSNSNSYFFYEVNGTKHIIAYYCSDAYDENNNKSNGKGTAYLKVSSGEGTVTVTSMADGVNKTIPDNNSWSSKLIVKQREDDGYSAITFLEVDWFMPMSLNEKSFIVGIHYDEHRSYTTLGNYGSSNTFTWSGFVGQQQMMTPMLFDPYLYLVNDGGTAGYGYAGVPYSAFYEPTKYTTSLNPAEIKTSDRSGNMYVMTTDTVQEQFYADIEVYRNKDNGEKVTQRTIPVDIPPYHRIYDFEVTEEVDSTGTYTGNNILQWSIKNPFLTDIIQGDYFELQRALKPDFSDAKQLGVIPMRRDSTGVYTYIDKSRETWTGNAESVVETVYSTVSYTANNCLLRDADGKPAYLADVKMS